MRPSPFRTERGAMVMLILTNLIWGGNYVASKVVVAESPPFTAAFVRFLLATALILGLYWLTPAARLPRRAEWPGLLGLGFIFCLYNLFFYSGLKATSSANAALLAATSPLITALLTSRQGRERLRLTQVVGLLVSFGGVALVVFSGAGPGASPAGFRLNPGDLLIMLASTTWSLYSLQGKRCMETLSPLGTTTFAWVIGTAMLLPAALLEPHPHGWFAFTPAGWWSLGYVILFSSVASFTWWYQGIQVVGANRASVFVYLIPLTSLALTPLLMKVPVTVSQLAGAVLILGGVYAVANKKATRPVADQAV